MLDSLISEPDSLDPARANLLVSQYVLGLLYDRLVYIDQTGRPRPWLAESWSVDKDGREVTFVIRKGVTFTDGTPLDAEAVRYSLDRFLKISKRNADLGPLQKIEVVGNGGSVRLTFERAVRRPLHRARLLVSRDRVEDGRGEGGRRVRAAARRLRSLHAEGVEGRQHAPLRAERRLPEPPRRRREQGRAVSRRVADLDRQGGGDADGGPRDRAAPHVVGAVRGGAADREGLATPAHPSPQGRLLHLPGVQHQEAALRQARPAEGHRLLGGLQGDPRRLVPLRHHHPGAAPARRPRLLLGGRPAVRVPPRRGEGPRPLQGGRLREGR